MKCRELSNKLFCWIISVKEMLVQILRSSLKDYRTFRENVIFLLNLLFDNYYIT